MIGEIGRANGYIAEGTNGRVKNTGGAVMMIEAT